MADQASLVQIKGIRDGLLVTLGDGHWLELQTALFDHIETRAGFFEGARITLDTGNIILKQAELTRLRHDLEKRGMSLWAVLSNSPTTEKSAQKLGFATRLQAPRVKPVMKSTETTLDGENAVFIRRTLRSGYRMINKGHVVVLGDVNPGAEIVSTGSVVVWGCLRGLVHAGAEGNEQAVVCALDLNPMQLRIASYIAVTPGRKSASQPEIARIENERVVAEPWKISTR